MPPHRQACPLVPALDAHGIVIAPADPLCDSLVALNTCVARQYSADVTIDGLSARVARGETVRIGTTSFTSSAFDLYLDPRSNCDLPSLTRMAGFNAP